MACNVGEEEVDISIHSSNEDEGRDEAVLSGRRMGCTRDDTFNDLRDVEDGEGGCTFDETKASLPLVEGTEF